MIHMLILGIKIISEVLERNTRAGKANSRKITVKIQEMPPKTFVSSSREFVHRI